VTLSSSLGASWRLANLPNFALDRLSRYEANLWRQADQIYSRSRLSIAEATQETTPFRRWRLMYLQKNFETLFGAVFVRAALGWRRP